MILSDWITLGGMAVTLISMFITISKAKSAYDSSQAAKDAMQSVQLAAIGARLKSAQEHIRDVAPDKVSQRGFKIGNRIDLVRREFDDALSALPKKGEASAARLHLTKAQEDLNLYQSSLAIGPDSESWQSLQINVQDSVSELATAMSALGKMK